MPRKRHLSPQARRRLNAHLHGSELDDLAAEIIDELAEINPYQARSPIWREHTQAAIRAVLADEIPDYPIQHS